MVRVFVGRFCFCRTRAHVCVCAGAEHGASESFFVACTFLVANVVYAHLSDLPPLRKRHSNEDSCSTFFLQFFRASLSLSAGMNASTVNRSLYLQCFSRFVRASAAMEAHMCIFGIFI